MALYFPRLISVSSAVMRPLPNRLRPFTYLRLEATWRSGYAAVCKTVYPGSIPGVASSFRLRARDGCRATA